MKILKKLTGCAAVVLSLCLASVTAFAETVPQTLHCQLMEKDQPGSFRTL